MQTTAEPAWFPDPNGVFVARWWDGTGWTPWVRTSAGETIMETPGLTPERRLPFAPILALAVAGFLVGLFGSGLLAAPAVLLLDGEVGDALTVVLSTIGLHIGLLGTALFVSRNYLTGNFRRDWQLEFQWRDLWTGLGQAMLARVVTVVVAVALVAAFGIDLETDNPQTEGVDGAVIGLLAFAVVAGLFAPITEEIFFRGVLQRSFVGRFGRVWGIVLGGIPFGLLHIVPGAGWEWAVLLAVQTYVLGLLLGRLANRQGRLGGAIATHAIFNLTTVLVLALTT